jgi:hypothetical protein
VLQLSDLCICHCNVLVELYRVLIFLGSKRLFLRPSGHILQTEKTSLEVASGGGPTSPLYEVNGTEADLTVHRDNSCSDAVMSVGENGSSPGHVAEAPVVPGHSGSGTATPPHPLVVIFSISEITCTVAIPLSVVIIVVMCI